MADRAFQLRSISMHSKFHPDAQIEDDLNKLRTLTASSTAEAICEGLREIGNVYDGIEKLLRMPCNLRDLARPIQRKWVDEELDLSLRLLDLSGAVKDGLISARENLQDLQFSLRRKICRDAKIKRGDRHDSLPPSSIKKIIANKLRSLQKKAETRNNRKSFSGIDAMFAETREISISLIRSASSFAAKAGTEPEASRWSSVRNALQKKKKVASEEHEVGAREKSMEALCSKIRDLEAGLDSLFKKLIQNRVSLLNILRSFENLWT